MIIFSLILIGIIVFTFFYIPDSIIYSKSWVYKWVIFLLILGGVPFSVYQILKVFYKLKVFHKKVAIALSLFSVLIVGPYFGYQLGEKKQKVLSQTGIIITGTVTKNSSYRVKAKFKVDEKWFETHIKDDENEAFSQGDSVRVIYSKKNPEINEIYDHYTKHQTTEP